MACALLAGTPGVSSAAVEPCVVRLAIPDIRINQPRIVVWAHENVTCDRYHPSSGWLLTLPDGGTRQLYFDPFHWPQPSSLTLADTAPAGTWHAVGTGSTDLTENVYVQEPRSFVVKRASAVALTATRAGRHVTTGGVARAYHPARDRFAGWPAASVRLQSRPATGGAWVTLSTYRANAAGGIPAHRWYAPQPRQFRLVAGTTAQVWAAYGTAQRR